MNCSCPVTGCDSPLIPPILRTILDEEVYRRWETLTFQKALDTMEDIHWCPRCQMPAVQEGDHLARCAHCFYAFCTDCKDAFHQVNILSFFLLPFFIHQFLNEIGRSVFDCGRETGRIEGTNESELERQLDATNAKNETGADEHHGCQVLQQTVSRMQNAHREN